MYDRIRDNTQPPISGNYIHRVHYTDDGSTVDLVNTTGHVKWHYDVMGDMVTKDFARRIKQGEIINNPAFRNVELREFPNSNYFATYTGNGRPHTVQGHGQSVLFTFGILDNRFPASTIDINELVASAKSKALSNVDRTPYKFMEDVLEIKKTVSFIHDKIRSIHSLVDSYDKVSKARAALSYQKRKGTADIYLQYQFALLPLVRSCYNAYEALVTNRKVKRQLMRASSFTSDSYTYSGTVVDGPWTWHVTQYHTARVKAGLLYADSSPRNDTADLLGLRGKDIPVGLWNAAKLSFMIDRVIDVATGLGALVNLLDPTISFRAGWVKVETETTDYLALKEQNTPDYSVTVFADYRKTTRSWRRDPWAPTVADVVPPLTPEKLIKDLSSIADLTALIAQKGSSKYLR